MKITLDMKPETEMLLKDILNSGINKNNLSLVTDDFVCEVASALSALHYISFRKEICEILKAASIPLTVTEIQFSIDNFVGRYITNQKVAAHLREMMKCGMVKREKIYYENKGTVVKYMICK